ncbi:MAG TPA: DNA-binding protein [Terriglobia bacterium]|nr:DNA-binding protein [Terriglobia bacterium]
MTARAIREHDGFLPAKAAAAFLGVEPATLAQWRFHHRYPLPFVALRKPGKKRGGRCYYRKIDLIKFMESYLTGRGSESKE